MLYPMPSTLYCIGCRKALLICVVPGLTLKDFVDAVNIGFPDIASEIDNSIRTVSAVPPVLISVIAQS